MCYLRRHALRWQLTWSKVDLMVVDWKRWRGVLREFCNHKKKNQQKKSASSLKAVLLCHFFPKSNPFCYKEYQYITRGAIVCWRVNWYEKGEKNNKYFNAFYLDISNCVVNNDFAKPHFNVTRGVRRCHPISPHLFILTVQELLAN